MEGEKKNDQRLCPVFKRASLQGRIKGGTINNSVWGKTKRNGKGGDPGKTLILIELRGERAKTHNPSGGERVDWGGGGGPCFVSTSAKDEHPKRKDLLGGKRKGHWPSNVEENRKTDGPFYVYSKKV